jgi:CelD/BcsL family acetyltransferase involved in cellulose biosynthesis
MNAEIFSTYRDLLKLKDRWDDLYAKVGGDNMFLTWEWHEALCRAFYRENSLTIVSFEDKGEFVGIAPLIRVAETLYFISHPVGAGCMDFLILRDHEAVFDCLLELLGPQAELDLRRVRQDSATVPALDAVLQRRGSHWHRSVEGLSPYVPAPPAQAGFAGYVSGRPKALAKEVKAAEKKLDAAGSWTFVREKSGRQAQKLLEALFELGQGRRRQDPMLRILGQPDERTFFMDLLAHYHRHLGIELTGILQGGKFLSCALGLSAGGRYYHWLMACDRSLRKTALGKLHLCRLMDAMFRDGCRDFDFMPGDESHKLEWADSWLECCEVRVFPGPAELYLHKARCTAKKAFTAVRRCASPEWRRIGRKRSGKAAA